MHKLIEVETGRLPGDQRHR